jgi:hypothetical protein
MNMMMTNERLNPLCNVGNMVKFRRLQEKDIVNNHLHRWLTFFDKSTDGKILEEII